MSGKSQVKRELITLYGYRCLLTGLSTHFLQYHHIFKQEWGYGITIENGALLSDEAHKWLHNQVEKQDMELFYLISECMILYKKCIDLGMQEEIKTYEEEIIPKVRERIKKGLI